MPSSITGVKIMFLLVDNYDSFTYNLVQAFYALGQQPVVVKNDDPRLLDMAQDASLSMVCISPGPGHPEKAGLCMEFLRLLSPRVPVLGVCLGHQALGLFAGASVVPGPCVMHGKASEIVHDGSGLFAGLPNPMRVGRYHSLVVRSDMDETRSPFIVTAHGPEGEIMALRYKDRPWVGVQFHPESILTSDGLRLLGNFPQAVMPVEEGISVNTILDTLAAGKDLTADMAAAGFAALMDGDMTSAQAGSFLMGLRMKGESALEMAHATRAALARAVRVEGIRGPYIEVVGTGGDGRSSFNCSTGTALTLAGMGYHVVKHGNRAVSSKSGSADALEGLGVDLDVDPASVDAILQKRHFVFLFAQRFHPCFRNIAPIRNELGIRTLFNLLGPLINPARPTHILLGVARPNMVRLMAETLAQSPVHRGAVVCGAGGYDEITPLGPNDMMLLRDGELQPFTLDPADFGIAPCTPEELAVHDREEAVSVLRELLSGRGPRAMQDMLVLNVGMGMYLLEDRMPLETCMAKAREALVSGVGGRVLHAA